MRNAFYGYTYQQSVALLMLAVMDVEREIDKMVLEAHVGHQFDDISIEAAGNSYSIQIKDFEEVNLNKLVVTKGCIKIGGKPHQLSPDTNIIFFKKLKCVPDSKILGFKALSHHGVYLIPLNRKEIDRQLDALYRNDANRRSIITHYFNIQLDRRVLEFEKRLLPPVSVFNTSLTEPTVNIPRKLPNFENTLFIEGKPGVGKSHLVSSLQEQYPNHLLYRFWVSSQDPSYTDRLKFDNFLTDLSKKIFNDSKSRKDAEILIGLAASGCVMIVDGLDHVENYNPGDLAAIIGFINQASLVIKTIVLSRPLRAEITWKKLLLANWTEKQTRQVLSSLYHIDDYSIAGCLYESTDGYPILVSYMAQQYKMDGIIPENTRFDSVTAYYDELLKNQTGKQAISLFLCLRGFLMHSEIDLLLDDYAASFVGEFIKERPYLFEIRLNRVSLFHDSLRTYLRNSGIDYSALRKRVNNSVTRSLLGGEKRFQSRVAHFKLDRYQIKEIIIQYASVMYFDGLMRDVVDFEAIREFYHGLRELLSLLSPGDLEVHHYYDLALILNSVIRDHVSDNLSFQYTYTKALCFNGYTEEDITSNKYLFAMWYYVRRNDASLLYSAASNDRRDTDNFFHNFENELEQEDYFFERQSLPFATKKVRQVLNAPTDYQFPDNLGHILINLYLNEANRPAFPELHNAVNLYQQGREERATEQLLIGVGSSGFDRRQAHYVLSEVSRQLLSLGDDPANNDYINLSLNTYLT